MPKTWLITGASRGLGRALTEAVLATGDRVVAGARDPGRLDDLVAGHPGRALAVALDVTDRAQALAAVAAAGDAFGGLDVVVNNAGYANMSSIEDFSEEDFRAQIETNLWGVVHVTRAALPVLREQRAGHIIQISSAGGRDTVPGLAPYITGKWAVEGFSGVLAKEVGPLGIKVTIVEPGGLRTDWARSSMTVHEFHEAYAPTVGMVAQFRESSVPPGDPVKAAHAIVTLAGMAEPPLRLLLGSDAWAVARAADEARLAADEPHKDLTFSIDHPGGQSSMDELRRLTT
jgi:NAD(P)-dependent dehydrogenase (short-subunit alcohol dehydrogenase family)